MYKFLKIVNVKGREVMDSRGNPTVEAEVTVKVDGKAGELYTGCAIVPSGAWNYVIVVKDIMEMA